MDDRIDTLVHQWAAERPELNSSSLDVIARVQELAKLLRRDEDEQLAKLKLKMWEYDVLSALRRQGAPYSLPASRLAHLSMLSSGAMTNRIDRLEERGLIERRSDPDDRRGVLVMLTAEGRKLIDEALESRLALAEAQVSLLSSQERTALASGLRKVASAIEHDHHG